MRPRSRLVPALLFLLATDAARAEEPAWVPLFDGKTTAGWRAFKKESFPSDAWKVVDGCLAAVPGEGAHRQDIVTAEAFTDFELRFTWRISPSGNSGVKYLVTEERAGPVAHEYQVVDDEANPDAQVGPKRTTAAFYDVLPAPADKAWKPAGQRNESRIVVRGRHVEHWLNGAKVLEYDLGSEPLRAAVAQSKFKNVDGFGEKIPGRILLQHHGDAVAFCAVEIRTLAPAD